MSWFRVDDGFPEHPKVEGLERNPKLYMAAITVWTMMGADCARRLTDGFVSVSRLEKVLCRLGKSARNGATALVDCGLWRVVDGGWQYHDWQEYQPTKADVDALRQSKTERQRRWRGRAVDASTQPTTGASRDDALVRASPIPSHPIPSQRESAGALSVRAPARGFAPSESETQTQTPELTGSALRALFRSTWLAAGRDDPPFPAEAELDDLAERVTNTAARRRVPPAQLFTSALEHWARSELNPREKRSPVQCFAVAFGEVIDQVVTSQPSAHGTLLKQRNEALRNGDTERYDALNAELRALNGGSHAPA
jgi:hypothetical protein